MVANIVPVGTPSNPGMGSKVNTIFFSKSSHVTYQIKGNRKFETFMAIHIDFINDFTYLLHFYFSENAKVRKTVRRKNESFNNF